MIGKMNVSSGNKIFASCDRDLLNTKIITDDFEIYFSKSFYGDREVNLKEIINHINNCNSANIFGNKICNLLLENKIILKESIIYIEKIPHVQIYKF
jgi:hypothetical protein